MDSATLAAMLRAAHDQDLNLHSILVVRHGTLVLEAYQYPYDATTLHDLRSCTKSVTATLVGIAIGQGAIASVDQPVLGFFPDRTTAHLDDAKRAITLRHLLTMSSGLDWPGEGFAETLLADYYASPDWAQFVLDRPMAYPPGEHFAYNSGGSNLLGAILENSTGMSALAYANEALFGPLGITQVRWMTDPSQSFYLGSMGMQLTPRDMAKIGYLYLRGGQWDGRQVVPAEWTTEATRAQVSPGSMSPGYGYQWWVREGYFRASGYGGQFIMVMPDLDLVVVFTAALIPPDTDLESLLFSYIVPAVKSSQPLPDNPAAWADLQAALLLSYPGSQPVPPLPEFAGRIAGKSYALEANSWGISTFALDFAGNAPEAVMRLDGELPVLVGLDGAYRATLAPPLGGRVIARASWTGPQTFAVELERIGSPDHVHVMVEFSDESTVRIVIIDAAQQQEFAGRLRE